MNIYDNPAFKDPQVQTQFMLLMFEAIIALWVVNDARTRGKSANHAFLWGLGTVLVFPIAVPLWFILRPKTRNSATGISSREPIPNSRDAFPGEGSASSSTRSKICDHCGKFYVGQYAHCPHCGAPISN